MVGESHFEVGCEGNGTLGLSHDGDGDHCSLLFFLLPMSNHYHSIG
jgi:hypothetical protein